MIHDSVRDAALNHIANNAAELVVVDAEPANFAGVAAVRLAAVAIDAGDFTLAAGDVGGRKLTMSAQTVVGEADGLATHYAIVSADTLLATAPLVNVAISNGNPQQLQAVDVAEIGDATLE